nr:hypothetical protein [uncultured Oribacterium sp.]
MSENQQVESEKQKVSEDQEKKNKENTAHKESKGQEGNNDKDKGGFFSLCPSILENNEEYKTYYEALDYAFQNKDIKNIAITGIYGAGKSTVWKSYAKERALKNIVTITLGQYESSVDRGIGSKIERETEEGSDITNYNQELEQENRIERKLINQIISQIPIEDTPISKYKIKSNKNMVAVLREVMLIISFFLAIIFWLEKDWISYCLKEICKSEYKFLISVLCLIFFIVPMCYFLFRFVRYQKMSIQKIQFKGVETNINDGNIDEESVLDKDIKEIIYLLTSAKVKTLVIEDLDRFNNITIFTKLRELNYMLNMHLEANYPERKVKFVYMLRDGLLEAKHRVKFFDFVLPILPYIHSRNSENILLSGMEGCGFKDNKQLIMKTSLYVGDMRILKSIVNDYRIYNNTLAMEKLQLSKEKLFVLMVVKNLFPYDFDLLQVDQGGIYYAFHEGKEALKEMLSNGTKASKQDKSSAISLKNLILKINENQKVEDSLIFGNKTPICKSPYIALLRFFIDEGYLSEDYWLYISPFHEGDLSYNDMVFMKRLIEGQDNVDTKIDNVEAVLSHLDEDDFMRKGILNETLLNAILKQREDYHYYPEDQYRVEIMMESIYENGLCKDVALLLATSEYDLVCRYIQSALSIGAYSHIENILIKTKELEEESGEGYDEYDDILNFLMEDDCIKLQQRVACSILTYDDIESVKKLFESEELKNLIQSSLSEEFMVPDGELDIIFKNLEHANIQFNSLDFLQNDNITYDNKGDKDSYDSFMRDIAERIQQSNTYVLNVDNIKILVNIILEKDANYGELLSEIYSNDSLESTKEYVRDNFNNFIKEYINCSYNPVEFKNSAEIVIEIINSDISEEDKIEYIKNNEVQIPDISNLTIPLNGNIAKTMYLNNTISCSRENISRCYAAIVLSDVPEFVDYLNRNINSENEKEILEDNSNLCEDLLASALTCEGLFGFAIKYAKKQLDVFPSEIPENKFLLLIESNLIKISKSNVHILADSSYTKSIDKWLELAQGDDEDDLVEFLCTENLDNIRDYLERFLWHLQERNAIKLIDKVNGEMKIYRIDKNHTEIKKYLLLNFPITTENIQYICKYFGDFEYQQEFVDSLISHNQFQDLKDEDLNKDVMKYLLTCTLVSLENKLVLLQTKIQNKVEVSELKEYIQLIDEIKDLNEVWNRKQPKLNSTYKQDIGKALADCGYVKIRNTSPISRIVLLDSQRL